RADCDNHQPDRVGGHRRIEYALRTAQIFEPTAATFCAAAAARFRPAWLAVQRTPEFHSWNQKIVEAGRQITDSETHQQ
ncbi:hypothetical protein, partial [Salinispora arenicola]|uniref:hypothetical protein n=1 Tax=Salinispora arenicola TaxID=168697 RepID=UPI0027DBF0E1